MNNILFTFSSVQILIYMLWISYNFDQDYRKAHGDWYETPKDESLVIKFTTSDEEKKDPENKE